MILVAVGIFYFESKKPVKASNFTNWSETWGVTKYRNVVLPSGDNYSIGPAEWEITGCFNSVPCSQIEYRVKYSASDDNADWVSGGHRSTSFEQGADESFAPNFFNDSRILDIPNGYIISPNGLYGLFYGIINNSYGRSQENFVSSWPTKWTIAGCVGVNCTP